MILVPDKKHKIVSDNPAKREKFHIVGENKITRNFYL